jgi:DNA primase
VGRSAVATLGANISNRQMDLLKRYFTSIILLPDNDEAGKSQSNKMNDSLGSIVTIGKIPDMYKDVSDMNNEQLSSLVYKFDNMVDYLINI